MEASGLKRTQATDSVTAGGPTSGTAPGISISLVLPVARAEQSVAALVQSTEEALARLTTDYEILLVGDGHQQDAELARLAAAKPATLRILHASRPLGYGEALRTGLSAATKSYVGIVAADTQLAPEDVNWLAQLAPRCDVICGYRIDRQDNWLRRTASKAYSMLADLLLGTNVRDCNGALKLFRREVLEQLAPQSDTLFINAELLSKARRQGLAVVEIDVADRKRAAGAPPIAPRQALALLGELAASWWNTIMFPTADTGPNDANSTVCPWHVALLMVVAVFFLFARLTFPLIEPDEARYALIATGMLDSGDWLIPTREGTHYLDKPPLLYWLTLTSYHILGVHDYAARMVTALAGLGTILATFWMGRRLVGERGALLGALMLLLSFGFALSSRFLIMDGLLALFTTATMLSLYLATRGPRLHAGWWLFASLACGLGVMTKGPVTLVLTLPPLVASRWLTREGAKVRLRDWAWFGAGIAAIALPWFIAVAIRQPGFLRYFFWEHHVMRYTTNLVHVEPWWFYGMVLAIGMFPASLLLPILAGYLFRRTPALLNCRTRSQGYLLLSAVWIIGFFSLSTGKLPPYILPALPPLGLLLGAMLDLAIATPINDTFMTRMRRWVPFHGTRLALIGGVILGVADFIVDGGESNQWIECSLLVVGSIVLYWYVSRRSFANNPARWWFAAAVPLALMVVGFVDIYPTIATKRSLAAQVAQFRGEGNNGKTPIICYGRYEDSLMFYNRDTEIRLFNIEQVDEITAYLRAHPRVLILSQEDYVPTLREQLAEEVSINEREFSRGKLFLSVSSVANGQTELSAGAKDKPRR